jgi:hypothetical protein
MPTEKSRVRERLAYLAARIMAQDGIDDFGVAKRKAARLEGVPDTRSLPSNEEIERELKLQRNLYQRDVHPNILRDLRLQAIGAMRLLEGFTPRLVGPIVTGTAGKHSDIRLQLFADSAKDVEIFLINRGVEYQADEIRVGAGEEPEMRPRFTFSLGGSSVTATVFLPHELRQPYKSSAEGKGQQRVSVEWLEAALKAQQG